MLDVRNLSLLKGKKALLKDIALKIPRGRITLILGKSGAGKTSLLRCLGQLESYKGGIFFQGKCLKKMSPQERRSIVGFVFQSYALFPHMSVLENCIQPLRLLQKKDPSLEAIRLLETLGLASLLNSYPYELSGGQQQRVALVRALLLN